MAAGVEIAGVVIAASVPATAAIGWLLRPVRQMGKDLRPLTEKDRDGNTSFDKLVGRQEADSAALAHLASEFPKNGVPTRTAVDAINLRLSMIEVLAQETRVDVAEVKAAQKAHVELHTMTNPQTAAQRIRSRERAS
jgi:hypothetical protein